MTRERRSSVDAVIDEATVENMAHDLGPSHILKILNGGKRAQTADGVNLGTGSRGELYEAPSPFSSTSTTRPMG